jgi:hypothetical protein
MVWKVDTVRKPGTMDQNTKENGITTHKKVKDSSLVLIKEFTQEDGKIINYMVSENLVGLMVNYSRVNMNTIWNLEKEDSNGQMAKSMMECGVKDNNMVKAST